MIDVIYLVVCCFHPGACRLLYSLAILFVFGLCILRWTKTSVELDSNPDCKRFDLLAKGHETKSTETLTSKNNFISGLKFSSININNIRGKKLELLAFLDFHQSQIVAIQESKLDSSIATSELFPESFP